MSCLKPDETSEDLRALAIARCEETVNKGEVLRDTASAGYASGFCNKLTCGEPALLPQNII